MSLPDIGFGSKTNHDQLGGATYPRYMVMYAERKETSDSTPNDEDPIFGFRGATTHTTGTEGKVYMGILNGVLPTPEHNITMSNLNAGIVIETDRVTVKPVIVLDPTTETIAPETKGALMYDIGTDELKYYDGTWQIVSAGGLSSHALDGAYHTATGLTVGWVLSADSPTTFSWKAPTGGMSAHDMTGAYHTEDATGGAGNVIRATGATSFAWDTLAWGDLDLTSSSLADLATRTHGNLSDAPADAHHVAFVAADFTTAFAAESLANLATRTHASLSDAPETAHQALASVSALPLTISGQAITFNYNTNHFKLTGNNLEVGTDTPGTDEVLTWNGSAVVWAAPGTGADNLGNHIATEDLKMSTWDITFAATGTTTIGNPDDCIKMFVHDFLDIKPDNDRYGIIIRDSGSDSYWVNIKNVDGIVYIGDSTDIDANMLQIDATTVTVPGDLMVSGTGFSTFSGTLKIASASDGKLELHTTNDGGTPGTPEGGWNYIEFYDMDGDRQGYFGIDSAGNFQFSPEVAGAEIEMGANLDMQTHLIKAVTSLSMTDELDMTGALACIDLNPAGTGTKNIIDITPSAALVAGSTWRGCFIDGAALDPATGDASLIVGFHAEFSGVVSADGDASVYAFLGTLPATENGYMFYFPLTEMTANKEQRGLFSYFNGALSATATYQGVYIDWDAITRDGGAPVLEGVRVDLPADYTDFGACYAGYFSGDGRSVTICDTTYALDVLGTVRVVGDVTVSNLITAGNVDGVDVSAHAIDDNAHHEVFESGDFTTAFAAESLANLATRTHASLSDAPADAHHVAFVLADFTTAFAAESLANLATRTHASLSDAPTDAHHSESHVLATTGPHSSALPLTDIASYVQGSIIIGGDVDWEALGAGTEDYVLKMGAAEPAWGQVDYSELSGSQPAPVAHNLIDTTGHPVSGLTAGHFLKALTTTTYGFAAHGLGASDVGAYTTAQVDSAIDTDINTHTSDDNAHHEVIEQSDVESIITAEIVEGQSIDNAIDALITTHDVADNHLNWKNSVGTIHTDNYIEYTDAAVESVIDAEIVDGQSIDVAIDALINTHNVANRHIDHSAVTITAGVGLSGGGTIAESRTIDCDITQYTDAHAQAACVSNAAYQIGWSGVDDVAASKNVLYDKISGMDTLIAANTTVVEVEAVITAEIVDGQSIDVAIDSLISNHAGDDNAHHEVFESGDFTTAFAAEDLGNLASRAYSSLTNIPSTFDPTSHGQSAHTGDVIPDANQSFTGTLAMTPIATTGSIFGITSTVTPTGALTGIDIDFTGITDNIQVLCGLNIAMPSSYSGSTDTAAYIAGAGRSVYFCSANYAIGTADDVLFADVIISGGALWLGGDKSGPKIIGNADAMELWTGGTPTLAATFDTSQNLTLASIAAEATDVDKFLVSNSGQVKFRTGAEAYADMDGYVDADAEAVITAELADGQSIDNAIDALISTHNVADRHIDHSTVSVIAGTGLSGGGTIAADRTINCDITQYTNVMAVAAVVAENPLTLTYAIKIGGDSIEDSAGSEMIGFTGAGYIDFLGGQGTPSNQDVLAWSTSNGRWEVQAQSGGGGITGSGTANVLTKWLVGGSTIQDSIISDDGSIATVAGDLTITGDPAVLTLTDASTARSMTITMGTSTADPIIFATNNAWEFQVDGNRKMGITDAGMFSLSTGAEVNDIDIVMDASPTDAQLLTAQAIQEYVDKHNNIGSGNSDWINCPYEGAADVVADKMLFTGQLVPTGTYAIYSVPLPTTRGGKGLFINGTRVSLSDASSEDYVTSTYIYGMGDTTKTTLDTDLTDKETVALHEDTSMGAVNLSGYDVAKVAVLCDVATQIALDIQYITVRYYYA